MACRECHIAKIKCDKVFPCSRCVRLCKECVPHDSLQGKARSRISEVAALSTEIISLKKDHYGMRYLLRSWVAIAMRRRDFALLARAGMVAERSGITLDDLLCEGAENRAMYFLYPILLAPSSQQQVLGSRLSWSEIPSSLLAVTGCLGGTDDFGKCSVSNRWIWIRETKEGVARYLTTPAFDRDIAEWQLMQTTYQENIKSVVELFLPPSETYKHAKALAHQVSLHPTPNLPIQTTSLHCKVKLKSVRDRVTEVSQIMCLCINNSDHDFTYVEYVPRTVDDMDTVGDSSLEVLLDLPLMDSLNAWEWL